MGVCSERGKELACFRRFQEVASTRARERSFGETIRCTGTWCATGAAYVGFSAAEADLQFRSASD